MLQWSIKNMCNVFNHHRLNNCNSVLLTSGSLRSINLYTNVLQRSTYFVDYMTWVHFWVEFSIPNLITSNIRHIHDIYRRISLIFGLITHDKICSMSDKQWTFMNWLLDWTCDDVIWWWHYKGRATAFRFETETFTGNTLLWYRKIREWLCPENQFFFEYYLNHDDSKCYLKNTFLLIALLYKIAYICHKLGWQPGHCFWSSEGILDKSTGRLFKPILCTIRKRICIVQYSILFGQKCVYLPRIKSIIH